MRTGWDYDAVFLANKRELDTYIIGIAITEEYLKSISPNIDPFKHGVEIDPQLLPII